MNYKLLHINNSLLHLTIFSALLFLFSFGAYQTTQAISETAPRPPKTVCDDKHDRSTYIQCQKDPSGIAVPINTDKNNFLNCLDECSDAGGAPLVYDHGSSTGRRSYCYEAQTEQLCEIKNVQQEDGSEIQFISTLRGLLTPGEGAALKALNEASATCGGFPFRMDLTCLMKGLLDKLVGIPLAAIALLPAAVLYFIVGLLGSLFWITSSIMKVFIESTMTIGVTPASSEIVKAGWTITRDLVNMLFLLFLVFVGLATILRLQTYQMQKTLPSLLIIALLVNFSGLLVGFFVDIGNILTNTFLRQVTSFGALTTQLAAIGDTFLAFILRDIPQAFMSFGEESLVGATLNLITQMVVTGMYYFLGFFIVMIIMIVFFVRVIVLWVLAILAPLAFAAFILPNTKQFWTMWFKQLIQWSFIGVPITFFMFLASKLLLINAPGFLTKDDFPANDSTSQLVESDVLAGAIVGLFGNFAVLGLMAAGIFLAMQFMPQGANAAIDFGKKWGGGAMKAAGTAAWRYKGAGKSVQLLGEKLTQTSTRIAPGTRAKTTKHIDEQLSIKKRELERMKRDKTSGSDDRRTALTDDIEQLQDSKNKLPHEERRTAAGRAGAPLRLFGRWAGRGIATVAGDIEARAEALDEEETAKGESEGTGKNSKTNATKINQELVKGQFGNSNRIVGLLKAIVKNGDSDDLQQYMREGLLDPKMIGKAMMDAQRGGPPSFRPLFKANYGRLLTDPESLGFKVKKDKDGKMLKDALGAPMFTDPFVSHSVREVPEKLSAQDITNKILGDTIDKGKAGGTEFMEFGGEIVIKHVLSQRGGDLVGQLMRRPESIEGRSEMSASINRLIEAKDGAFDKTTLESLYRYFTSSGARSAGLGLDIIEGIAVSDEGETIPRINLNDFLRQYIATTPSSSTSETSSDAHPESDSGGSNTPQGP